MSIIAWDDADEYLRQRLEQLRVRLEEFQGSEFERGRLAGEIRTMREVLHLPETLELLRVHDKEAQ